MQIENKMF